MRRLVAGARRPCAAGRTGPALGFAALATVLANGVAALGTAPAPPAGSIAVLSASPPSRTARDTLRGRELARLLGCGACHAGMPPADRARTASPPLGPGATPLAPAYVFHYLADPRPVRPGIAPARMPAYDLEEAERVALALFATHETEAGDTELQGVDQAFLAARTRHPDADREAGGALFDALGCAGCHEHAEATTSSLSAPDLSSTGARVREDWLREYLARPVAVRPAGTRPGRGERMPDFRLETDEASALSDYLTAKRAVVPPPWTALQPSPFAMAKAEFLIREQWSCLGCHQLGDEGGRIGPRLDGVGQRLRSEYVRALIEEPSRLAPHAIMPGSFEQPDRLDLIASFLLRREGTWRGGEPIEGLALRTAQRTSSRSARERLPNAGRAIYRSRCAPCHGEDGSGAGFNAPFLPVAPQVHRDGEAISLRADDTLYDGIYGGGRIMGKNHRMPAFGPSLNDAEIRAAVAYIRELCECRGPAWSTDGRRR